MPYGLKSFLVALIVTALLVASGFVCVGSLYYLAAHAQDNPAYEKPDVSGPYPVNVAFPNLDDYVKATGCKWVDKDVLAEIFRSNGHGLGAKEIFLITFPRRVSSEYATREMLKMGFIPATSLPLFALGITYEEFFPGEPIVALGSPCRDYRGELCVLQISTYFGAKKMYKVPADDGWRTGTRFAVIRYK